MQSLFSTRLSFRETVLQNTSQQYPEHRWHLLHRRLRKFRLESG